VHSTERGWTWRTYPGLPAAAALARRYVRHAVSFDPSLAQTAAQLVGELFANAVTRTRSGRPGGIVHVGYLLHPGQVRVAVRDQGQRGRDRAQGPDRDPAGDQPAFVLIERLAADWGWMPDGEGRIVWALLGHRPG
jgi:anti-sigma regulatory factor (Ser/Thr protein kinase)